MLGLQDNRKRKEEMFQNVSPPDLTQSSNNLERVITDKKHAARLDKADHRSILTIYEKFVLSLNVFVLPPFNMFYVLTRQVNIFRRFQRSRGSEGKRCPSGT